MRRGFAYNAVAALQILFSSLFHLLLARSFGASISTDAYLVSTIMVEVLAVVATSFTGMFVQYYNDVRAARPAEAERFYQAAFNFVGLVGLASLALAFVFIDPLITLFAPGFDGERAAVLRHLLGILTGSVVLNGLIALNTALMTAEMNFLAPYAIGLLAPVVNTATLVLVAPRYGITAIAVSTVLAGLVTLGVQQRYIATRIGLRLGTAAWHPSFRTLIPQSIMLRMGHQLWSFKDAITTNVLSGFATGTVSLYLYGSRIVFLLFLASTMPSLAVFFSTVSRLLSEGNVAAVTTMVRKTLAFTLGLFLVVVTGGALLLPHVLAVVFGDRFDAGELRVIHTVFLALIPFHLVLGLELPFASIANAMKRTALVVQTGVGFLAILLPTVLVLREWLGIYAIPAALVIAQCHNLARYYVGARRLFQNTSVIR